MSFDTNSESAGLRNQIFIQLIALIIVTGTLTVYLYRQASVAGKHIAEAQRIIDDYNQVAPQALTFVNGLEAYGAQHPDFSQQVLKKYGITPQQLSAASAAMQKH